jgi:energy-coupling factor transport system ATP-binding protein
MNVLELDHLTYTYPGAIRPALTDINLNVVGGERLLVGGPSGSGKSTLLRTANGLVPHFYGGRFAGRARVLGVDTRSAGPQTLASRVGMVFQDLPARFLTDSVEDEIAFSLELAGSGRPVIASGVRDIAERMGVAHLAGRRLEHLSAGEQARLAIAAALARKPDLLLMDEPVTHIDPAGAGAVVEWVGQLSREEGVAVLVAEHRVEGWRPVVDRWIRLPSANGLEQGADPPPDRGLRLGGIVPAALRVRGVGLSLGRRPILRDVDLDLAPGELAALVGRNGSGKTTLLRTLVGLQRLDVGEIDLGGESIVGRGVAASVRRVGFVPQAPASMLFADTAEDEILLTLRQGGADGPDEVAGWLEAFGLTRVRQSYPRDLSAGERQRLALAAILAGKPSVLLLDEPTLGMDRERLRWLGRVLAGLCRAGCAILVATHDVGFVAEHATRALLQEGGRIVVEGTPDDVLRADPAFDAALTEWRAEAGIIDDDAGGQRERHADG